MRTLKFKKGKKARAGRPYPAIVPVAEAIAGAAAVLDGETAALEAGAVREVAEWAERKRQAEASVRAAAEAAAGQGLEVRPGSPEAEAIEEALRAFRASIEANEMALRGASMAVGHALAAIRKASVQDSSEGMYSRSAAMVVPAARRGFGTAV